MISLAEQNHHTMKKAFKIYKEGTTEKPVTILKGDGFDESAKRAKYISLGYTITEI